jgi:hypothetical protein
MKAKKTSDEHRDRLEGAKRALNRHIAEEKENAVAEYEARIQRVPTEYQRLSTGQPVKLNEYETAKFENMYRYCVRVYGSEPTSERRDDIMRMTKACANCRVEMYLACFAPLFKGV